MGIILTLIRGLLLLMAPVVSTASSGPVGGCGRRQGWGYVYNKWTEIHTQTPTHKLQTLKTGKSHYKAVKRKISWRHTVLNPVMFYHYIPDSKTVWHSYEEQINKRPSHVTTTHRGWVLSSPGSYSNLSLETSYLDWGRYFATNYSQVILPFDLLKQPLNKARGTSNVGIECYTLRGNKRQEEGRHWEVATKVNSECNPAITVTLTIYE